MRLSGYQTCFMYWPAVSLCRQILWRTGSCVQCVQCVYSVCPRWWSTLRLVPVYSVYSVCTEPVYSVCPRWWFTQTLPYPPIAPSTLYDRPSASDHRRAHCRRRWMWRRNWRRILLPCVGHCSDQSRDWQIFWALSAPPTGISLYILIILIKWNVEWSLRFLTEVNHICLLFCHI